MKENTMNEHDELAKYKRGAKTLGEIIEKQCRDVLDVTGLHHLINEDGDGHWDVVWMRLFEMRDELASLKESTIGRERLRGDSWRDQAQEMEVARDAATERAEAAEKALEATKPRFSTTVIPSHKLALTLRQEFSGWMGPAVSFEVADAVIAAGWRPPGRRITTVEELDALPVGSIVRGDKFGVAIKEEAAPNPRPWAADGSKFAEKSADVLHRLGNPTLIHEPKG